MQDDEYGNEQDYQQEYADEDQGGEDGEFYNQEGEEEEEEGEQFKNNHESKRNNAHQSEQQRQIEDKISEELEEKLKVLDEFVKGKSEEQALNIRMHQLALAKILVFTHGKGQFKLVIAHTNIGEAYLNYKCFEQAIDHLTVALKKNGKLFSEDSESKSFHSVVLTLLGKCYLEIGSHEDSLELLKKAYEIQTQVYGDDSENSVQTVTLIANCQSRMKDYEQALESIIKVYNISEARFGYKSEQTAFTFIETAKIHACQEEWQKSIEYQKRAIGIYINCYSKEMLIEISYDKPDYVAELYTSLASFFEKVNQPEEQISALSKVRTIYSDLYGTNDKKVIKIKRQISIILLKNQNHQDALQELYETEELETKVYGESSVQVAKTQKIIGTILILTQEYRDALQYLQKSLKIFEENGMKKVVTEIKQKVKLAKEMKEKGRQQTTNQKHELLQEQY